MDYSFLVSVSALLATSVAAYFAYKAVIVARRAAMISFALQQNSLLNHCEKIKQLIQKADNSQTKYTIETVNVFLKRNQNILLLFKLKNEVEYLKIIINDFNNSDLSLEDVCKNYGIFTEKTLKLIDKLTNEVSKIIDL